MWPPQVILLLMAFSQWVPPRIFQVVKSKRKTMKQDEVQALQDNAYKCVRVAREAVIAAHEAGDDGSATLDETGSGKNEEGKDEDGDVAMGEAGESAGGDDEENDPDVDMVDKDDGTISRVSVVAFCLFVIVWLILFSGEKLVCV